MFSKLFILFAVLPILEIMLLINVSDSIGGWNTFALVLITAFFGAYFVRREGMQTLASVQHKLATGEMPGKEMSEGLLLLVAGVLLVTPGFITDGLGLLFTLPLTRAPIAKYMVANVLKSGKINAQFSAGGFHNQQQGPFGQSNSFNDDFNRQNTTQHSRQDGEIIDAEYTDKSDKSSEHNDDKRLK